MFQDIFSYISYLLHRLEQTKFVMTNTISYKIKSKSFLGGPSKSKGIDFFQLVINPLIVCYQLCITEEKL